MYTFGCGMDGRLGHGIELVANNQTIPEAIEALAGEGVVRVGVGPTHGGAATADGRLLTWGQHRQGQLGHDCPNGKGVPAQVEGLPDGAKPVALAFGRQHSAVALDDGSLWTWGSAREGALGHGPWRSDTAMNDHGGGAVVARPRRVEGALKGKRVVGVSCGRECTVCVTDKGEVFSFGADDYGQLGQGKARRFQNTPKLVRPLRGKKVTQVSCGEYHTVAVTEAGEVYSWGVSSEGQTGHGRGRDDTTLPRQIEALEGVPIASAACGGGHTCLVARDGRVWCCGRGRHGQLGRDARESVAAYRNTPVTVEFFAKGGAGAGVRVAQVACGADHTVALAEK